MNRAPAAGSPFEVDPVKPEAQQRTRDRILDGAMRAVARHGLVKLRMGDVSQSAGLSRGTVYRYFPNREKLLDELARREADRFQKQLLAELEKAEPKEERIRVALLYAARLASEHPVLRRLLETDSAFVLGFIREQLPVVRAVIHELLAPVLEESSLVRAGIATPQQLVDWLTRVMISAYLFPDPHPDEMVRALAAVHRALTVTPGEPGG